MYIIYNPELNIIKGRGWSSSNPTVFKSIKDIKLSIINTFFINGILHSKLYSRLDGFIIKNVYTNEEIDLLDIIDDILGNPKTPWYICQECTRISRWNKNLLVCNECYNYYKE